MSRGAQQAVILMGLVVGLGLIGPRLARPQITWVRMGVEGMR